MHFSDLLHIDRHLPGFIHQYGIWFYAILFVILFAETGFVVTPFLPGDTLLFAAGLLSGAPNGLNLGLVLLVLTFAPMAGDAVNYHVGKFFGPRIFHSHTSKLFNKKHLDETHEFFDKYGPHAVMIARWVPIVRTLSPFVSGMSGMPFHIFMGWSALGAVIWVWVCTLAGFWLGSIAVVRDNFELAMLAMVFVTVLPLIHKIDKTRRERKVRLSAVPAAAEE